MTVQIGVIGGSGLYDMAELTDREDRVMVTPFGEPSGPYVTATLRGQRVTRTRRGLFLGQERLVRGLPFGRRHDTGKIDHGFSS